IAQEEKPRLGGFGLHKGKGSRKYVVVAILYNGHQKHSAVSPIQVGSIHRHKRLAMFDPLNAGWEAPKNLVELATLLVQPVPFVIRPDTQIDWCAIPKILQCRSSLGRMANDSSQSPYNLAIAFCFAIQTFL
ncbi:hypothetical protein PIB30_112828, partial [Stylosanthes scabra]|nr:hypothetical protein [Stylosanthes scabra]